MNLYLFTISIFSIISNLIYGMHKSEKLQKDQVIPTILEYSKKLKKEENIDLRMYGVRCAGPDKIYDGKVHEIDIGYSIDRTMNIEEGRKLFYRIVDGLLDIFNSDENFREGFYHYPVSYEDLYFRLSFDYENKGYLHKGDVSMIAILCNKIKYFIAEEDGANASLEMKQMTSNVSITTGLSQKTRCITKLLPETE